MVLPRLFRHRCCGPRAATPLTTAGLDGHILSLSGFVDLIGVIAVPIALALGVSPPTAWLWASLWVLKLAQDSPAFAQIGRVFMSRQSPSRPCWRCS